MSKKINAAKKDVKPADKKMDQIMVRQIKRVKIQQLEFIVKANNKKLSPNQKSENSPENGTKKIWRNFFFIEQKLRRHNCQKIKCCL